MINKSTNKKNFIVSKISKQIMLSNKKEAFFISKTLSEWIKGTIEKVVIEEFVFSWTNKFWLDYYFKKILPVFNPIKKVQIKDKLKDGFNWIQILENTYYVLIAFALHNEKDFHKYKLYLIEKIAKKIKEDSTLVSLKDDIIIPTNLLEYEVLSLLQKKQIISKKQNIYKIEGMSYYDEAASIMEYINKTIQMAPLDKFQVIVPSSDYFQLALKPIFLFQNIDFYFLKKESFENTLICKLLFCLNDLYFSNFDYKHLMSFLFLVHNNKIALKEDFIFLDRLIPFFKKYNIEKNRFFDNLEFSKEDLKIIDKFKSLLSNVLDDLNGISHQTLSQRFYSYYSLLVGKIIESQKLLINSEIQKFLNTLYQYDDLLLNYDVKNLSTKFLKMIAKNIFLSNKNRYSDQSILVSTNFDIISNIEHLIIMGSDVKHHRFTKPKLDLPNVYKDVTNKFYQYFENSSLKQYRFLQNVFDNYPSLPVKNIVLSYTKYQGDSNLTLSHKFSTLWNQKNDLFSHEKDYLLIEPKTINQILIINKSKTSSLYSKFKNTVSSTSLNMMFNDNYLYHIMNGIGINKYPKIRFDNSMLGTWIHQVLSLFFDEYKAKNNNLNITTFLMWKKDSLALQPSHVKSITKMSIIIKQIAYSASILKRIKNLKILSNDEIDFWVLYISKKIASFVCTLSYIYIENQVKVEATELQIGHNKELCVNIHDENKKTHLEIKGSIDQVISCYNEKKQRKEYYLLDFKANANNKALNIKKMLLCVDNQILLYLRAFLTKIERNSIIRGFFYLSYYQKKVDVSLISKSYSESSIFVFNQALKTFSQSHHNYVILNQNLTKTAVNNLGNNFLDFNSLKLYLNWYDKEIIIKHNEIKKGILSSFPINDNKWNPLYTLQAINWLPFKKYVQVKSTETNSFKHLISIISSWDSNMKERKNYIEDYQKGM